MALKIDYLNFYKEYLEWNLLTLKVNKGALLGALINENKCWKLLLILNLGSTAEPIGTQATLLECWLVLDHLK